MDKYQIILKFYVKLNRLWRISYWSPTKLPIKSCSKEYFLMPQKGKDLLYSIVDIMSAMVCQPIAIVLLFVVDNPAVFLSPVTAWHSLIKIQFKIHFGSLNHKSAKSHSKVNTFSCKLTGGFLNIFTLKASSRKLT